jgi:hypothetical protein
MDPVPDGRSDLEGSWVKTSFNPGMFLQMALIRWAFENPNIDRPNWPQTANDVVSKS